MPGPVAVLPFWWRSQASARPAGAPAVDIGSDMGWALALAIAWAVLALPTGYLIGRSARRADARDEQPAPVPPVQDEVPVELEAPEDATPLGDHRA